MHAYMPDYIFLCMLSLFLFEVDVPRAGRPPSTHLRWRPLRVEGYGLCWMMLLGGKAKSLGVRAKLGGKSKGARLLHPRLLPLVAAPVAPPPTAALAAVLPLVAGPPRSKRGSGRAKGHRAPAPPAVAAALLPPAVSLRPEAWNGCGRRALPAFMPPAMGDILIHSIIL